MSGSHTTFLKSQTQTRDQQRQWRGGRFGDATKPRVVPQVLHTPLRAAALRDQENEVKLVRTELLLALIDLYQ